MLVHRHILRKHIEEETMVNRVLGKARTLENVMLVDKMARGHENHMYLASCFNPSEFIDAMKYHIKSSSPRWLKQNTEVLEAVEQLKNKLEGEKKDD